MLQTAQLLQDRYRLDHPLSQTAGRQTWLATDLHTQDWVVVKLLAFSDAVQWDRVRLFEREANMLRQLQHDRIPRYRDQFCLDDRLLWFGLVHDYIPGRSLKDQLSDRGWILEEEAQAIAAAVLEILIYLHGLNPPVLHRDIKPSNLINGEGQIYLIDFGTVQDRIAAEGATFTVVGTYGYVPLEQLGGRALPASDLYALGTTLIHLVTGIAPADLPQQDGRLQFESSTPVSTAFHRWLLRMSEPNLDRRFTTAQQALNALKTITQGIGKIQPSESRIHLQKTSQRLATKLPASNRVVWLSALLVGTIVYLVFMFPLLSTSFLGILTWIGVLAMIGIVPLFSWWLLSLPSAISTQIVLDAQRFEICWKLLGIRLHRVRGKTADIDRVYTTTLRGNGDGRLGIGISAGIHEYRLSQIAPRMSQVECDWLAGEIAAWLGLLEEKDAA